MRVLHAPVWDGVLKALHDIFDGGWPADQVIRRRLKENKKWGSQDRRLFSECVYDIVRWWRRLTDAAGTDDYEVVAAAWVRLHDIELDRRITKPSLNWKKFEARWNDPEVPRAIRQSIPDWLDEVGQSELGERWPKALEALNSVAPVFLRVNRLKADPELVRARLAEENIQTEIVDENALRLVKRANVFLTRAFKQGLFEVQDLNSQKVVQRLEPRPGERVIDACAGAGGKTLHISALMKNKGQVIALDVSEKKLEELRTRSNRAGATCIDTRLINGTKVIKRLHESADRVLLDVPCSGLGVLRRNPDSKWKLKREDLDRVRALQSEILRNYSRMVRPGGRLVYSTCSILPSENERQIEKFLTEEKDRWKLVSSETLFPEDGGGDGFFIAVLDLF